MTETRLPTRIWFRKHLGAYNRGVWERFYTPAQIASGEAERDAVATVRGEYPKAHDIWFATDFDEHGHYNPRLVK